MPLCSGGDPSIVRSRSFIAVAAILAVLIGVVAAMGVLDARAKDHIAKGVRVGGVDVGGLTPKQARAKLHAALLAPLGEPIVIHHDRKSWHLTAARPAVSMGEGQARAAACELGGVPRGGGGGDWERAVGPEEC